MRRASRHVIRDAMAHVRIWHEDVASSEGNNDVSCRAVLGVPRFSFRQRNAVVVYHLIDE
jgi:hypothetical protein